MFVHGSNLEQKESHATKYRDEESKRYLAEIRQRYDAWKAANLAIVGPTKVESEQDGALLSRRVALLNSYKDFVDQQHYAEKFDSRSNLHSSVLEEFMFYLFKDLVQSISSSALIGKSHTFKDIFFRADSYADMLHTPTILVEKKDHDFAIGVHVEASFKTKGQQAAAEVNVWDLPAVAVECKTYLDKENHNDQVRYFDNLSTDRPDQ